MVIRNPGVTGFWARFKLEFHRTEYARWWYWAAIDRPSCWSICLIFFANNADISFVWLCEKTVWKAYGWEEISIRLASAGATVGTFRGGGLIKQKNSRCLKFFYLNEFGTSKIVQGGFWMISLKKTLISRYNWRGFSSEAKTQLISVKRPKRNPWSKRWLALSRPSQFSCQNPLVDGPICNGALYFLSPPFDWI